MLCATHHTNSDLFLFTKCALRSLCGCRQTNRLHQESDAPAVSPAAQHPKVRSGDNEWTVHHRNLSTHSFCSSTHHDVLECQPITKILIAELLLLSKSFVWVLHVELTAELLRVSKIFIFTFHFDLLSNCEMMLATSSSFILTTLTYLAGLL